VLLRRVFDQAVGRQRAIVRVNGALVGTCYVAEVKQTLRWADRDFFIPKSFAGGRSSLAISIEPAPEPDLAANPPPQDAASHRAISVVPPPMP
jgi:hypothetical protein